MLWQRGGWAASCVLIGIVYGALARADEPPAVKPTPASPTQSPAKDVITNSIGMKLVPIPAGEFMMGGQESAEHLVEAYAAYHRPADFFKDEYPLHRVRITRPFYMGQCEVTVGQFRQFVDATHFKTQPERDGEGAWGYNAKTGKCEGRDPKYSWHDPGFVQADDSPVIDVTWNDVNEFCRWLSKKEGKKYRLPTEAEWEYACRAGTTTRYSFGDDPRGLGDAANVLDDRGRTTFPHVQELDIPAGSRAEFTKPTGKRKPNAWGLYDMHGNVWEWCSDWYGKDYYAKSPVDDPQGPATGSVRARRGGGWNSWPLWARVSMRNWNSPATRCVNVGFRVVREEVAKP
ncbi:MAG: formylglycine-generating enzyme family protein [Planctomycetia bacterium]|nr:formylglycine-generating enzyme family protein [Planctomycetia bacterium]